MIRAYTGMERTLARQGLGRRPFEAPLEYLARTLVALRVSRSAGERLTAVNRPIPGNRWMPGNRRIRRGEAD